MQPILQKILVVGGNGFIGSHICKLALARGMEVTSISSSGRPFRTPNGHTPAWTSKIEWKQADALRPETYEHILPGVHAVVHTLGTLLEDTRYKTALANRDVLGLAKAFFGQTVGSQTNPLERAQAGAQPRTYDILNRDSALRVCESFVSSTPTIETTGPRTFVYVSAEDIFRPFIPRGYIETKREAEQRIDQLLLGNPGYKSVHIRPSLVYHAYQRPLTTPAAALIDLSAVLHSKIPPALPTPSSVLKSLGSVFGPSSTTLPSPWDSMGNALVIPPIHVEHVAEAICVALDPSKHVEGVVGVGRMRELIGWVEKGEEAT